jgi:hypothetical protein
LVTLPFILTDDGDRYFLFVYNANTDFAYSNLGDMGFTSLTNITGVSHISEYNPQVLEPSTPLLLGNGFVSLAPARRKVKA